MEFKGAIFDFDGTLFDSMFIWEEAGSRYLRSLGKEPEDGLDETLRPMSLNDSADYLAENYGIEKNRREILRGIADLVEDFYFYEALPKPGVAEFLKELKAGGVSMVIATASETHHVEAALRRCGLREYFIRIISCGDIGCGKDRPDIFRSALEALGTDRAGTVVFEDSIHAVQTAKADGFTVAALFDPFERRAREVAETADLYLNSFAETEIFRRFIAEK